MDDDDSRMARDEASVSSASTLSFEKRTQLLNSKFAILNRDFVRFLCEEVTKDAEIDLTPTVSSYIDNVKDLRRMYNLGSKEDEKKEGEIVRKKATARRRLKGEGEKTMGGDRTLPSLPKTPQLKMSTPAGLSAPSTLEMSADISAISPFGGCNVGLKKVEKDAGDETLKALPPTIGAPSAGAGGRKRAIRGGGPSGDGESVVFRGAGGENATSTPTITVKPPPVTFQLPKATAGFWSAKPSGDDKKEETKKEESKSEEKKEEAKPFTFGSGAAPKFTGFNFGGLASSSSSTTDSAPKLPPATGGFNLFGATTTTSTASSSSSTPTLTFGVPKPSGGLTFPSFAPSTGNTAAPTEGGADGDEEGEYVPPKAEVVENTEEDAKISLKCGVFKLEGGEYAKLGVGQLYVKESEGKSTLLVRAATATGTILVNGRIDGSMKAEKAAVDKLRVSVPVSSTEIKTFLIRLPSKDEAEKVLTALKDGGAK